MKVEQLIEELKKLPKDAVVVYRNYRYHDTKVYSTFDWIQQTEGIPFDRGGYDYRLTTSRDTDTPTRLVIL